MRAKWHAVWFTPQPASVLALWRTALGVTATVWLLSLSLDLGAFYGEGGVNPDPAYSVGRFGILRWWESDVAVYLVFFVGLAAALLLVAGRGVRVAAPVLALALMSLQSDNSAVLNSGDSLLRIWCVLFAIFALLTPSRLSGAPLFGVAKPRGEVEYPLAPTWFLRLVQLQLTVIYPASVVAKFDGEKWLDGTASLYALGLEQLERFPVPDFFRDSLFIGGVLTYSTLALEITLPFLLWIPRTRRLAIVLGLALHIGFDYPLRLGFFAWSMAIGYVAFLTPAEAAAVAGWLRRLWSRVRDPLGAVRSNAAPRPRSRRYP